MSIDWERIQKHKFAEGNTPSHWPKKVKLISMLGLQLFGLDDKSNLYWDGKKVEIRKKLSLSIWQKIGALTTVLSAAIMAYVELADYLEKHKIFLFSY